MERTARRHVEEGGLSRLPSRPRPRGNLVDFLDDETADSFSLFGTTHDIASQLRRAIEITGRADIVVPHPVPMPNPGDPVPRALRSAPAGADYKTWFATEVMPLV